MSGLTSGRPEINAWAGQTVLTARIAANQIRSFKLSFLDRLGTAGLTACGLMPDEIADLNASFLALNNWVDVGDGKRVQAELNNFWFNAAGLAGPQYPG